ncbi:MAG: hypothetical protein KQI35_14310 [Bacteroidetes bacterium]|nr:hypothetical protein [Bacteroidota bacterium]
MESSIGKSLFRKYGSNLMHFIGIALFTLLTFAKLHSQEYIEKNLRVIDTIVEISPEEITGFEERAKEKLNELQNYITIIGDKEQDAEDREYAIQSALKLFIPGSIMQVSNKTWGTLKEYEMRVYFRRLMSVDYNKVEIIFYKTAYISGLQKGPDGKYHGTATIFQEFKGYTGENLVYSDMTTKTVDIVLDYIDDKYYERKRWELLLGDVKVAETR